MARIMYTTHPPLSRQRDGVPKEQSWLRQNCLYGRYVGCGVYLNPEAPGRDVTLIVFPRNWIYADVLRTEEGYLGLPAAHFRYAATLKLEEGVPAEFLEFGSWSCLERYERDKPPEAESAQIQDWLANLLSQ